MSVVKLYQVDFGMEQNALIDDLQTYLSGLTPVLVDADYQYQKIDVELQMKFEMEQEAISIKQCNYIDLYQDDKHFYFYIAKATWKGTKTVQFRALLDTVNTFVNDFTFTEKTKITRQHENRFYNNAKVTYGSANTLVSKIDDVSEGISAIQYKDNDVQVLDNKNADLNQHFYLVYRTPDDINATDKVPIECRLVPKLKIPLREGVSSVSLNISGIQEGYALYFMREDNMYNTTITFGAHVLDFSNPEVIGIILHRRQGNSRFDMSYLKRNSNEQISVDYDTYAPGPADVANASGYRLLRWYNTQNDLPTDTQFIHDQSFIGLGAGGGGTFYSEEIKDVDRTDTQLLKIIECPYCPIELSWLANQSIVLPSGWSVKGNSIVLDSNKIVEFQNSLSDSTGARYPLSTIFEHTITPASEATLLSQARTVVDPKTYHSDFYTVKGVYDSYATNIALERMRFQTLYDSKYLYPTYKQSNGISSDLLFKVDFYPANVIYKDDQDYSRLILSNRNNEYPIYTNEYLSYMRTGYNFDRKQQALNNATGWLNTGFGITGQGLSLGLTLAKGAGAGGLAGFIIGGAVSSIAASLTSQINQTVSAEQTIQNKQNQLKAQSASVNGSDDLNLLNYYNGNKLRWMTYKPSEKVGELIDDLFYYTGYARNIQGIPNLYNRVWFNYIQCEPDFDMANPDTPYSNFLEDLSARYQLGVTVFHRVNGEYDFAQEHENWEHVLVYGQPS